MRYGFGDPFGRTKLTKNKWTIEGRPANTIIIYFVSARVFNVVENFKRRGNTGDPCSGRPKQAQIKEDIVKPPIRSKPKKLLSQPQRKWQTE